MRRPTILRSFEDFIDWWSPVREKYREYDTMENRKDRWKNVGRLRSPDSYTVLAVETHEQRHHCYGPDYTEVVWTYYTRQMLEDKIRHHNARESFYAKYLDTLKMHKFEPSEIHADTCCHCGKYKNWRAHL